MSTKPLKTQNQKLVIRTFESGPLEPIWSKSSAVLPKRFIGLSFQKWDVVKIYRSIIKSFRIIVTCKKRLNHKLASCEINREKVRIISREMQGACGMWDVRGWIWTKMQTNLPWMGPDLMKKNCQRNERNEIDKETNIDIDWHRYTMIHRYT